MNQAELEHILRAAADVTGESDFVVVGSTAILAQFPDAPELMLRSNEADIYPVDAPDKAWDIEGSLGYGSLFHETHGYFADGIGPDTALLPTGWRARAWIIRNPNTRGASGICPDIHDLAASKAMAGRDKDREWIVAGIQAGLIDVAMFKLRLHEVAAPASEKDTAVRRVDQWTAKPADQL